MVPQAEIFPFGTLNTAPGLCRKSRDRTQYAWYYGSLPNAWDECFDGIDYGSCQIRIHSGHPDTIPVSRLSQDAQLAADHRLGR